MGARTNQQTEFDDHAGPFHEKERESPDDISIEATTVDSRRTHAADSYLVLDNITTIRTETKRKRDFVTNASLLGALFVAYSMVRSLTADEFTIAMLNATELLSLQESLGIPSELSLQQSLIERTGILKAANVHYVAVHFPLTIVFLTWVWLNHRSRFNRVRNTLIGVTAAGLVMHVTYPLAPPRMIEGFVDTGDWLGPDPYDSAVAAAANQIAAMPSLHVGWAFLVAISAIWILNTRWRWLALAHPVLTSAVVVVTANHYWSDGIVAIALVVVGWFLFSPAITGRLIPSRT